MQNPCKRVGVSKATYKAKEKCRKSFYLRRLARLAGFEPTACRLGEANSVRICVPSNALECLILLDF